MFTKIKFNVLMAVVAMLFFASNVQAHWSTKGPYGGKVSSFGIADTSIYLGSPNGGVYRATSLAFSAWVYRNYNGLSSGKVTAVTGIGKKAITATADSGIFVSTNLGVNWTASNSGLTEKKVLSLVTSSNGKIFAGTNGGGVFLSTDSGATWSAVNTNLGNLTVNAIASKGDTLLAGTNGGGVFASLNAGGTWLPLNTGITDLTINTVAFNSTSAFAGTASGVYVGDLTTFTWSLNNTGLGNTVVNSVILNNDTAYVGTNAGVFFSPVASVSWTAAGSYSGKVTALFAYKSILLAGTDTKGVYKSTIGTFTWSATNSGFNNLSTYALGAKDSVVVVANEQGVFVAKNYVISAVYVKSNTGLDDSLNVQALQLASGKLFAGTKSNGVYVSADTGKTWSAANTNLTDLNVLKLQVTATAIYAATASGKVFSSPLGTISWTEQSTGLPSGALFNAIAHKGDTIFVALGANGIYANTGSAGAWVSLGLTQNVTAVTSDGSSVYAGTNGAGVFKHTLKATSVWTASNTGLNSLVINALYSADGYVVAGYRGAARASCNGGKTWYTFSVNEYIPNYSDVVAFADITPRILTIIPNHSALAQGKAEYPQVKPALASTITAPSAVCGLAAINLSIADDADAVSYKWTLPSGWSGTSNTNAITATPVKGADSVSVFAINGCGVSDTQRVGIKVDTIPTVSFTLSPNTIPITGASFTLTGGLPVGGTYSGAGVSGGSFNPATAGLGAHIITYKFTTAAGCSDSTTQSIAVTAVSGINEISNANVVVYPNPFSNELIIKAATQLENVTIILQDITGRTIQTVSVENIATVHLNTSSLSSGIYFVRVLENGKTILTQKVSKSE